MTKPHLVEPLLRSVGTDTSSDPATTRAGLQAAFAASRPGRHRPIGSPLVAPVFVHDTQVFADESPSTNCLR